MAKYDDLIEEASGELDRVEAELYSATQQLLDLQGELSQLTQESYAAEKTMIQVILATLAYFLFFTGCTCFLLMSSWRALI